MLVDYLENELEKKVSRDLTIFQKKQTALNVSICGTYINHASMALARQ